MIKKIVNKKIVLGVILGIIFGTLVTYKATILCTSSSVAYDNTNTSLTLGGNSVTNFQDAIDALHNKYATKTPVTTCKTGYTLGKDYGTYYECIPQSYAITTGYVCERAKWLHKEKCTQSSYSCYDDGYYSSGSMGTNIITYGKLGTSGGALETGDALDCDVNGNGYIDVDEEGYSTERFYYVSPRWTPGTDTGTSAFDSSYAVLIYYSNTYNGVISNTGAAYATQADIQAAYPSETISTDDNWHGPVTAIKHLPKTKTNSGTWNDYIKKNNGESKRAIIACNDANCTTASTSTSGGSLPQNFSYEGYAGRLLTIPELKKAGCDTLSGKTSLGTEGALKACNFLFEKTKYAASSNATSGPLVENADALSSNYVWFVYASDRNLINSDTHSTNLGVRPAIEVPISQILK